MSVTTPMPRHYHNTHTCQPEEVRKEILSLSEQIASTPSQDRQALLIHSLRRQVALFRMEVGNVDSAILCKIKNQIAGLSKAVFKHPSSQALELQSACLHALSDLDPKNSLSHLKKLLKMELHQSQFSLCQELLLEISPKLPHSLQERISHFKDLPQGQQKTIQELRSLCNAVIHAKEGLPLRPNEAQGLVELDHLLSSPPEALRSPTASLDIASLLIEASGSQALNAALKKKSHPTQGESFLIRFSYASRFEQEAKQATEKLKTLFHHKEIQELFTCTTESHQLIDSVRSDLQKVLTSPPKGVPPELLKKAQQFYESLPVHMVGWHWLESASSSLGSILALLELFPQGTPRESLLTHLTHLTTLADHIKNATAPSIQRLAKRIPIEQKLTKEELMTLARFSDVAPQIESIQAVTGHVKDHHRFCELIGLFNEASSVMKHADTLFHSLPGFQPGDILLDIEELEKKSSETLWSKERKRPGFHPSIPFRLIGAAIKKGGWSIVPYFIGKVRHAAMAYSEQGALGTTEVFVGGFIQSYMPVRMGMKRLGYRPNFDALLTSQGKELLQRLMPTSMMESLHQQYAHELHQIMKSQHRRFSHLYAHPKKGWESFALDLIEKGWHKKHGLQFILGPLASLVNIIGKAGIAIYEAPISLFRKLRQPTKKTNADDKPIDIVCSQFILELAETTQKNLERHLIKALKKEGLIKENEEVHLFHSLLPQGVDPRSVHPKKLRTILKKAQYTKLPTPLGIQLILQSPSTAS